MKENRLLIFFFDDVEEIILPCSFILESKEISSSRDLSLFPPQGMSFLANPRYTDLLSKTSGNFLFYSLQIILHTCGLYTPSVCYSVQRVCCFEIQITPTPHFSVILKYLKAFIKCATEKNWLFKSALNWMFLWKRRKIKRYKSGEAKDFYREFQRTHPYRTRRVHNIKCRHPVFLSTSCVHITRQLLWKNIIFFLVFVEFIVDSTKEIQAWASWKNLLEQHFPDLI